MLPRRKDRQHPQDSYDSVTDLYADVCSGLKEKADHNKTESQLSFSVVICSSLLASLFVTLGEGLLWGKIVPASLSVLSTAAASWLQLRKPQRLWAIYRRGQRQLEQEKTKFDFKLEDYGQHADPEKLLAQRITMIEWDVHEKWEGLVPDVDSLSTISPKSSVGRKEETD